MRLPRPKFLAKPRYRFPKRFYAIITRRKMTVLVLTLAYTYFILMGGIYIIVNKVPAVGFTHGGLTIVFQSLNRQFGIEGAIAAFLVFLGAAGMRLMNESIKYVEEPEKSSTYSLAGLVLFLIAIAGIEYMISLKT